MRELAKISDAKGIAISGYGMEKTWSAAAALVFLRI